MTSSDPRQSLVDAAPEPLWLDDVRRPAATSSLVGSTDADLAVVGGGFSGLWTALLAKQADPGRDVVLLEGDRVGWAASGRNGGFCSASLTHGFDNGIARWPEEMPVLTRMGEENLAGIAATVERFEIDCDLVLGDDLTVATTDWQDAELREWLTEARAFGLDVEHLDRDEVQAEVASPTYVGGLVERGGTALVNPARLAWGLLDACRSLGVRVFERTPVRSVDADGAALRLSTSYGEVRARRVALGTNAFPPLLRRISHYVVPVYDYVLATEPLSAEQLDSIGWKQRQGISDAGNQFHYYRLTSDDRIVWGGYDAIYHFGNDQGPHREQRPETFAMLAEHFFATFPQLEGLRFTHAWGGVIDTCTRFAPFWGMAYDRRLAYVAGYTGLGVGSTRFGAQVMLDLLSGASTERTRLEMVRRKPLPFPPEPARWAGIEMTRRAIARADETGRRGLWLKTLDRLGLGFDS